MTGPDLYRGDSGDGPDPLLILWDGVRYLAWWLMAGLVVTGSWWFTGYRSCGTDWLKAGPPRRGRAGQRDPVAREAVEGIAALEAYLDSFAPGQDQVK
ncbi:hypothetical protein ACVBEQ_06830 [Nakamurella sp. GG22]